MKKPIIVLFALLTTAEAQTVKKYDFSIAGGIAIPNSPSVFQDYWKYTYHASGGFGYRLSPKLMLTILGEYYALVFNESTGTKENASSSMVAGFVNLRYAFSVINTKQKFYPYILGGAGVMNMAISSLTNAVVSKTLPPEQSVFALDGGVGIDYRISTNTFLFLEGRATMAFVSGGSYVTLPARLGVRTRF